MSIRERLEEVKRGGSIAPEAIVRGAGAAREDNAYHDLKSVIHKKLLDRVDLAAMEGMSPERLRDELRRMVERLLKDEGAAVNDAERRQMVQDVQHEVMGLGPLEPLLADPTISDIMVNTHRQVYVERFGKLHLTDVRFSSNAHVMKIIDRIVSRVGRRIDESSPMVDARLPDGSRVNAVIPPLALDGPLLSIRRFSVVPLKMDDLVRFKSLTPGIAELISGLVKAKINLLVSGGTGSGKTTLLNILSGYIPAGERIVTIEDAAELQLQQPHVVRMETRPPNIEGKGEVTQRALVRNSLRMRPDRIILGEIRGAEVLDMLQAMNTGHEGSMTTVHANTPRDAMTRLENMMGMAGMNMPPKVMRQQVSSAISVVIQASRMTDGKRKIVSIQEVTGMEGDVVTMQEIFTYEKTGIGQDGAVLGHFRATGIRPKFIPRMRSFGVTMPDEMFDPARIYE